MTFDPLRNVSQTPRTAISPTSTDSGGGGGGGYFFESSDEGGGKKETPKPKTDEYVSHDPQSDLIPSHLSCEGEGQDPFKQTLLTLKGEESSILSEIMEVQHGIREVQENLSELERQRVVMSTTLLISSWQILGETLRGRLQASLWSLQMRLRALNGRLAENLSRQEFLRNQQPDLLFFSEREETPHRIVVHPWQLATCQAAPVLLSLLTARNLVYENSRREGSGNPGDSSFQRNL
ncbi:MAG: hypothetical protein HYU64_01290 [Armatimonadetes bacterium]|nr:hypothetical protein [Armatimonadota bacterium]